MNFSPVTRGTMNFFKKRGTRCNYVIVLVTSFVISSWRTQPEPQVISAKSDKFAEQLAINFLQKTQWHAISQGGWSYRFIYQLVSLFYHTNLRHGPRSIISLFPPLSLSFASFFFSFLFIRTNHPCTSYSLTLIQPLISIP